MSGRTITVLDKVARCRWCVARLGHERWRIQGVWRQAPPCFVPSDLGEITDGICPDCFEAQLFLLAHPGKQSAD